MSQIDATGLATAEEIFARWFEESGKAPGLAWGVVADGALVHAGGLGTLRTRGTLSCPW